MCDLSYKAKIRLYFPGKISLKSSVKLENKQVHYLIKIFFLEIKRKYLQEFTEGQFLLRKIF